MILCHSLAILFRIHLQFFAHLEFIRKFTDESIFIRQTSTNFDIVCHFFPLFVDATNETYTHFAEIFGRCTDVRFNSYGNQTKNNSLEPIKWKDAMQWNAFDKMIGVLSSFFLGISASATKDEEELKT